MGVPKERAYGARGKPPSRWISHPGLLALFAFLMLLGASCNSWALQRHEITPQQAMGGAQAEAQHGSPGGHGPTDSHGAAPAAPATPQPSDHGAPHGQTMDQGHATAPAPGSEGAHGAPEHGGAGEHGEAGEHAEGHGAHGPPLPTISPIPGVTFVETMINLMDYELHERFLGWRPNDIVIGRFTDNVNNYQLGVLEALRFTTLRLKDSLTRMGDADSYDPDLEHALNLLMNSAYSFWFPSAESSYGQAVDHLRSFLGKLKSGQRSFYYRKDNLITLLAGYRDLQGNINKSLVRADVGWLKSDDSFYYAKGVAHVYYEIFRVVRVGYQSQLASTMNTLEFMDEIIHELHRVEVMNPWLILDSDYNSLLANHRANINAPLSEVGHLLVVLSQL